MRGSIDVIILSPTSTSLCQCTRLFEILFRLADLVGVFVVVVLKFSAPGRVSLNAMFIFLGPVLSII